MNKKINEFPITIYGQVEKYNEVLSKARCRIFYKQGNRNGTFITDEFAQKLINSLPYVPVKGIYEDRNFTDHGESRTDGQVYGIVPADPNFAWEKFTDEDGVEREYACADVLLFSALYPESAQIIGSAQSMELYEPSLKYHWTFIQGRKWLVFDDGCFLGLQVLGTKDGHKVEPCFEGAAFYTLQESIENTIKQIKEYTQQEEQSEMNFKLSDEEKYSALFSILNPNCTEEGGWVIDVGICAVYDEYALVTNYKDGSFARVYYKKNDEENSVEITDTVPVFVMDVTENEKNTIEVLRKLNGETFELVAENLTNADENAAKIADSDSKIDELNAALSTLQMEADSSKAQVDELNANYAAAQSEISSLNEQITALTNYKLSIEKQQKEAVIADYADKLSEEVLATYTEKLDEYSVLDLDKDLAYELKKINGAIFAVHAEDLIPKDQGLGGIEEILSHYKK